MSTIDANTDINILNTAQVRGIVVRARRKMKVSCLLAGLVIWLGVFLGVCLSLFILDNLFHLPAGLRLALGVGVIILLLVILWEKLVRPLWQLPGVENTALYLEKKFGIPENLLINALQFEQANLKPEQKPFAERTITAGSAMAGRAPLQKLWQEHTFWRWLLVVIIVTGIWGVYVSQQKYYALNAMMRFTRPLADIPPAGRVRIKVEPGHNITLAEDDNLRVVVHIFNMGGIMRLQDYPRIAWQEGADYIPADVRQINTKAMQTDYSAGTAVSALITQASQKSRTIADYSSGKSVLNVDGNSGVSTYYYEFKNNRQGFAFRIFAANTYSRSIKVNITRAPRVSRLFFRITPPVYTGIKTFVSKGSNGDISEISVLNGSKVQINVMLDRQADSLSCDMAGKFTAMQCADNKEGAGGAGGLSWRKNFMIVKSLPYKLIVKAKGISHKIPVGTGTISLKPDMTPVVDFVTSQLNRTVNPGSRLQVDIQSADDYGLREIYVTAQPVSDNGEQTKAQIVKRWVFKGPPGQKGSVTKNLLLNLDAAKFPPGHVFIIKACASDFNPRGVVGQSQPLLLRIRSLEQMQLLIDDKHQDAMAALDDAIEAQRQALGVARNLQANFSDILGIGSDKSTAVSNSSRGNRAKPGKSKASSGSGNRDNSSVIIGSTVDSKHIQQLLRPYRDELSSRQGRVGWYMTRAGQLCHKPWPNFVNRMLALRDTEHKQVMLKIHKLTDIPGLDSNTVKFRLDSVIRLQNYILEQLIALKGNIASQDEKKAEKAAVGVLPVTDNSISDSLSDALKKMSNELKDFVVNQKKIMHERAMLADKAPEDLTTEDEDKLDELAVDQSRLAEILANAVNDLTNTDLQDFGDDAMVDKMKAIFRKANELEEKARQAAAKRQDRVDAHRLETESVEMAKELEINCEATLGTYDNTQFIAEIAEDEQLVAPLAELPEELEDLIADMATTEEEMKPEVEDIGSYLNSLDHTAGPIGDGTISSTSAKGKTGDQKPEDNVIQGRSGAGRSGMSDGQMVESVARALPQNDYSLRERVSNSPLESGHVKDEDKKAQTGATGLGKTTDQASIFGVGGKLPKKVLDMMKATRSRQLNIALNAQQLIPKLRYYNLSTVELKQAVNNMKNLEKAMGKFDAVAIRRSYSRVLDALQKSKQAVAQDIKVQYRKTSEKVRRLNGIMADGRNRKFSGYENMISAYFEAMAK